MPEVTTAPQLYYAHVGIMTDPREHADMFAGLPATVPEVCHVIQGILLHKFTTNMYDVKLSSMRKQEVFLRNTAQMLGRLRELDDQPLTIARPPEWRLVGNCRDFAVMLCSMLRYQGIPARMRSGFASYFLPGMQEDHRVCEYWHAESGRWIAVDAQLDEIQRGAFAIDFDPLDVPPERFMLAGRAWQLCRAHEADSRKFGIKNIRGMNFIRANLLFDFVALNKVEVLPWDFWWNILLKEKLTIEETAYLDRIAELTISVNDRFPEVQAAYENDPQMYTPVESRFRHLLDEEEDNGNKEVNKQLQQKADGRPQGAIPQPQEEVDGRPQGAISHPQMRTDGRPQGAPPHINPAPVPTMHGAAHPLEVEVGQNRNSRHPFGQVRKRVTNLEPDKIVIRGAQQHNLQNIDVAIPRYKLVVLTGVSGSGKSSLAFDTIYAEGQRRYVESLSPYVRHFLEKVEKPKVDFIGGLSPAIAIEQKTVSRNPRSTVGTVTEVMHYLRLLYSRVGTAHCVQCGNEIQPLRASEIAAQLALLAEGTMLQLLAPVVRQRKGSHADVIEQALQDGYTHARIDGKQVELNKLGTLVETKRHTIELVVAVLEVPSGTTEEREEWVAQAIQLVKTALRLGHGALVVDIGNNVELTFSNQKMCSRCGIICTELTSQHFSFNSPLGMCLDCNGLGTKLEVDPALIVADPTLSILDGALRWYGELRKKKSTWQQGQLASIAEHYHVDLETPWQDLPQQFRDTILYGSGDEKIRITHSNEWDEGKWSGERISTLKGVIYHIDRLFRQTRSEQTRRWYASFMSQQPCTTCDGSRLNAEVRAVTLGGKTISEIGMRPLDAVLDWVESLYETLNDEQLEIADEVLKEASERLQFMLNVGLHYLSLDRAAPTLSGGEGQRIRLASQLGCGLVGVLYVLDEPSIGLHPRDHRTLLDTLLQLRDMGNTVLVVEHDAETMRRADWLIDLGPGAGILGGNVVTAGPPQDVIANSQSLTGRYLSDALTVSTPKGQERRMPGENWLGVTGARLHNLKHIDARFPLGLLTCVTGVSGSGKSSLINGTLYPALAQALYHAQNTPGPHERITGLEHLDKVINITQDPIGRTPRSNPATYVGVYDEIRKVFAATPQATAKGYRPDRFSFNVSGGRCEECRGHGQKVIEMHFLSDVWVTCKECGGTRFNRETLAITYKGKNIAEVLNMDVQEALSLFADFPKITRILQTLHDVGLDYVKLGQSALTLSGGEAQRVKLAKELSRVATGRTLYILDEPTTGLHFADIQRLLDVLHKLVAAGNTVIVIEHNLDVIKTADWLIDLGPEGGANGGWIIAEGTPEDVAKVEGSYTGRFLR